MEEMSVRSCWRGAESQGPSAWTIHCSWSSIVWNRWFILRGLLSGWADQGPERQTTYLKLHNRPKTRNVYFGALFTRAGRLLLWQLCFSAFQAWLWPMVSCAVTTLASYLNPEGQSLRQTGGLAVPAPCSPAQGYCHPPNSVLSRDCSQSLLQNCLLRAPWLSCL